MEHLPYFSSFCLGIKLHCMQFSSYILSLQNSLGQPRYSMFSPQTSSMGPTPDLLNQNLHFYKPPGWLLYVFKFEKHWAQ